MLYVETTRTKLKIKLIINLICFLRFNPTILLNKFLTKYETCYGQVHIHDISLKLCIDINFWLTFFEISFTIRLKKT